MLKTILNGGALTAWAVKFENPISRTMVGIKSDRLYMGQQQQSDKMDIRYSLRSVNVEKNCFHEKWVSVAGPASSLIRFITISRSRSLITFLFEIYMYKRSIFIFLILYQHSLLLDVIKFLARCYMKKSTYMMSSLDNQVRRRMWRLQR